jgi:hypothetical protein
MDRGWAAGGGELTTVMRGETCGSARFGVQHRHRNDLAYHTLERAADICLDLPEPFITFLDPVATFLPREGEDHLAGVAGPGHDRQREDLVADGVLPGFDSLDCRKRDLLWGQEVLCPVNKDNAFCRQDPLERDRLDINSRCPQ